MRRFRRHDEGALTLEESESDPGVNEPRQWVRLEPTSMRFGYLAPPGPDAWRRFCRFLLEQAPCHLTINDLDIDHLEVVYGFDMEFSGNHDQLIADTLFSDHPLSSFAMGEESVHTIDCQPCFGIALNGTCDLQAYLETKSRTSPFEVRTGEYEAQVLSVYLTVRRYWGVEQPPINLFAAFDEMLETADELAIQRIVPLVVNPLALAIASRP